MAKCLHSASHQLKPINWQILPHCWEKWQGIVLDKYPTMLAKFTTRLGKSASIAALIPHFSFSFSLVVVVVVVVFALSLSYWVLI